MTSNPKCPICAAESPAKKPETPYHICPSCHLWFQYPPPPKIYAGAHEERGDLMSDADKAANEALAGFLFDDVMKGKCVSALDVGSKYPYLSSRLASRGVRTVACDGDPQVADHRAELGIDIAVTADFETSDEPMINIRQSFDLITLVHVFEHFYDPVNVLQKLRRLVADDGRVYIRLPDHNVPGYERDLTPGHFTIHPYFHTFTSILEALVQCRDCFVVEMTRQLLPGQREIVLRPIKEAPSLGVGMIVKNEARDIGKALGSIVGIADVIDIVDTGSTDLTMPVAAHLLHAAEQVHGFTFDITRYLGASEQDGDNDWKLWDFAKARNRFLANLEGNCDYVMWLDADDVLQTPEVVKRATYWPQIELFGMRMQNGPQNVMQHRMWKANIGIRFEGACHEYSNARGKIFCPLNDSLIVHDGKPGDGEASTRRNLRILLRDWDANPTSRNAFYLGATYFDMRNYAEAAEWFELRVLMDAENSRDEWLFAYLYLARCHRQMKDNAAARKVLGVAMQHAPTWAEFRMEAATLDFSEGKYTEAIDHAMTIIDAPIPITDMAREPRMYRDVPMRLISECCEMLGNIDGAIAWSRKSLALAESEDPAQELRILRLESLRGPKAPAILSGVRPIIGLCRPGAIGDILMTLNLIPMLKAKHPEHEIHYFCDERLGAPSALGRVMRSSGVDMVRDSASWAGWRKTMDKSIELVGYPLAEGYPDKSMRQHLLRYFAAEMGLNLPAEDALPALIVPRRHRPKMAYLDDSEPYATIQTRAGWSAYKEWMADRWREVIARLPEIPFVLVNESEGRTIDETITLVSNARIHVGIDSFCNHLTNYIWTKEGEKGMEIKTVPGVILWGSTQHTAAGYPHNINLSLGLSCQPCFKEDPKISTMPQGICLNPPPGGMTVRREYGDGLHACMRAISVERVVSDIQLMWHAADVSRKQHESRRIPLS